MKRKAAVINLGCPKNLVDSEVISGMLAAKYLVTEDPTEAGIIVVNTCGFIVDAKKESIEMLCELAELKKAGKCERIYAVGCLAQRYGKELIDCIPELDGVLTGDPGQIVQAICGSDERRANGKKADGTLFRIDEKPDFIYSGDMPRLRFGPSFFAYVKIAEGCDNCCSYCAIPSIKGRYRSRTIESVVAEVNRLAAEGVTEIALVAQDTTRFGLDIYGELRLPVLLRRLAEVEGIQWIRLLYCYPDLFSDQLIEIIREEPKICKYVDLPLQHADDEVLARMNRRNTAGQAMALIKKLRRAVPDIFLRSTFITGFPGETEANFQNLLAFIQEAELDRLGVFAYSREENTPAAKMKDQVPLRVRVSRKEKIMELQAGLAYHIQQRRVGGVLRVIAEEQVGAWEWIGRTEGDAPEIDGEIHLKVLENLKPGQILKARILWADSYDMRGEGIR